MSATDDVDPIAESNDVKSDFQDRSIACIDCNEPFTWTAGEQIFFHDKGLKNEPKVAVMCAQCGAQTTVPFYPSQGRPVYCRSCFLAGRTQAASA